MKLIELEPQFLKHVKEIAGEGHGRKLPDGSMQWGGFEVDSFHYVNNLNDAHGITFLCPKCYNSKIGTHQIHVYFRNSPYAFKNREGHEIRWEVSGNDYNDLTLMPSILLLAGCNWHGFVINGEIKTC